MQTDLKTFEGKRKEISAMADKFGDLRLRVIILEETPNSNGTQRATLLATPAERAARLLARIVDEAPKNAEELREAQEELDEMKQNMNAERIRSGAEPIF